MQEKNRDFSVLKARILKYLDFKGISKYECYQKTGITNGVFSQSNGMSEDNTLKFLSQYSDISPEWFLTGRGEMLKSEPSFALKPEADYEKQDDDTLFFKKIIEVQQQTINSQQQTIQLLQQTIEGFAQKYDTAGTVRTANAG